MIKKVEIFQRMPTGGTVYEKSEHKEGCKSLENIHFECTCEEILDEATDGDL